VKGDCNNSLKKQITWREAFLYLLPSPSDFKHSSIIAVTQRFISTNNRSGPQVIEINK